MTDVTGQVGQARVTVGGTGAAVTLIRFIAPPAQWRGEIRAEGKVATRSRNVLVGYANVRGFAPTVGYNVDVTAQVGRVNAQGFQGIQNSDRPLFPSVGIARVLGFRPSNVVYDFRVSYPLVGEASATFARFSAQIDIIRFLPGMTPGTLNLEGKPPAATGPGILAQYGQIRVQGFAPSVTPGKVINAQVGRVNFTVAGFTPDIERQKDIDGPYTGNATFKGSSPLADVIRVGGIFRNPQVGYARVVGFAGTRTITRTPRPRVGILRVRGYRGGVAIPLGFVPQTGYVSVTAGIEARVTRDRWQPVASEEGTWAAVLAGSTIWSDVEPASSTWSAVQEAI